ncbi:thioesterase family protein [Desemzia sp. RIT804]|uniref:thioesterase family protein n=1 Tax=Desemzia sp. RIT 804 TaxID=2810209 RepID=UPI00194E1531|nr:thioesterase family protein [Desemzia sp. RIT 804]MBM6613731.1 thioesterase family protein [Desemzia sp. RIT 804]
MSLEKKTQVFVVEPKDTAAAMKSGDLEVLATPALVSMIENTAKESIREHLTPEETTVGIEIQLQHLAPSAVGKQVICEVILEKFEKSIFSFQFKALVDGQLITSGTHKRARVNKEKFLQKMN